MKEFFRIRLLHLIYFSVSILIGVIGLMIKNSDFTREITIGVGNCFFYGGIVFSILLFILFLLPRKVFSVWKFISIPFILYIIIEAVKMPTFGDCMLIGCNDRDRFVALGSFIFSLISLGLSIIIAFIWHLIEKYRKK